MDNSLKTKEKPPQKGGANAPTKVKTKTFPIGKKLTTKDLLQTAVGRASGRSNQNPRIAYAERRVKPLARLLRCATALRVTAPHGCGSGVWYGRKGTFRPYHAARIPRFWAWCDAIERYQMRYKITG